MGGDSLSFLLGREGVAYDSLRVHYCDDFIWNPHRGDSVGNKKITTPEPSKRIG